MASLLGKAKSALSKIFEDFGSSKIPHKIDIFKEGNKIFIQLDVSGHVIKERIPLHITSMEESRAMVYIEEATTKLCIKAAKAGLLTND